MPIKRGVIGGFLGPDRAVSDSADVIAARYVEHLTGRLVWQAKLMDEGDKELLELREKAGVLEIIRKVLDGKYEAPRIMFGYELEDAALKNKLPLDIAKIIKERDQLSEANKQFFETNAKLQKEVYTLKGEIARIKAGTAQHGNKGKKKGLDR